MKKTIKQLILLAVVVTTAIVCLTFSASALNATGQCGENVYWDYNATTKELIISGKGEMYDYYVDSPFEESDIRSIVIESGISSIGDFTFYNCYSLQNLSIGDGVTTIGEEAFSSCYSLTSVTLPDSVTTIGEMAFIYCDGLMSVTISDNVTNISDFMFYDCDSLTSVTIPYGVTTIGTAAFSYCVNLTSVTIPDSVTTIGDSAFNGCKSLTSATIPNSVKSIGEYVFYDCVNLENLTIGNGLTSIGYQAFGNCNSIKNVYIADISSWAKVNIDRSVSSPMYYTDNVYFKNKLVKDITIPNSVTSIGSYAFSGYKKLESLTIANGVTSINNGAFYNCSNLKNVTIGNSIKAIASNTFYNCSNLENVTIGNNVKTIGYQAFYNCSSLKNIIIGNSIETIEQHAFTNCHSIENVYANDISSWLTISFFDFSSNPMFYGKNLYFGNKLAKDITIPNSVTSIKPYTFYNCTGLESVIIPKSVKSIGEYAFHCCINLKKATIGNSVISIGSCAFFSCNALETIIIPSSVTEIGSFSFSDCCNLKEITIGTGTQAIKSDTFTNCSELKNITIFNKNCEIAADSGINSQQTIYAYKGSNAESFANEMNMNFVDITTVHTHTFEIFKTVKATCTKAGKIVKKCICGAEKSTVIYYPKTIKLSSTPVTYNGSTRSPSVTVKDSKGNTLENGTDYDVTTPSGRKLPGQYKYTIKFKGNYSGKKELTFTILPKAPTNFSATQSTSVINLKWKASEGATGYRVYQYSPSKGKYVQIASVKTTSYRKATNLKAGTEYKFKVKPYTKLLDGTVIWGADSDVFTTATECKAPKITSVTSSSKSKATVKWSNVDGETGYQLYYSTSKNGTYKKVDSYSANKLAGSKTFSSSASGKTIYFKVRAYKKVNGQTIYSEWSAVKSVKLK